MVAFFKKIFFIVVITLILPYVLIYGFFLLLSNTIRNYYCKYKFLVLRRKAKDDLKLLVDIQKILNENERSVESDKRRNAIDEQIDEENRRFWIREKLRRNKISHRLAMQKSIRYYKSQPAMVKLSRSEHIRIQKQLVGKNYNLTISGKINRQKYLFMFKNISRKT